MKIGKLFLLLLTGLFLGCDVNFENFGIPDNEASYRIKILDESYDIATEMSKYTQGVSADQETGELCIDTIITYNEGSNIKLNAVSYAAKTFQRPVPFFLSGIDAKNVSFSLKEISEENFSVLDNGAASLTFPDFSFQASKSTRDYSDPYLIFQSVTIRTATLKVTVKNQTGFEITSLKVKVYNSDGESLATFSFPVVDIGDEVFEEKNIGGGTCSQYIDVEVEGNVKEEKNLSLSKTNSLAVNVSFENYGGYDYQISADDYVGKMQADTVEASWTQEVKIDRNGNGESDFDIYNVQTTYNTDNVLKVEFENFSESNVKAMLTFPQVQNSKYDQDSLSSDFTIMGRASNQDSREGDQYLFFSDKYLGEDYSPGADLVDTITVLAKLAFPETKSFVRASEQKVKIKMDLASLEIDQMECKVIEDVIFGENSGSFPVDLNRLKVTDKNGNEVKELKMLGEPTISFRMNSIISKDGSSEVEDIIKFETKMESSRDNQQAFYQDSLLLDISPFSLSYYESNLPDEKSFLNLLKILPEEIAYSVLPTIKASDSVVKIDASENMDVRVHISSPITFDTEGDSLIFELREDYGDGFEGMRKEFHSAKVEQSMFDNYLGGEFILEYKNSSNMLLGAKVIISTDKSVLYDDDIQTNATTTTMNSEGFPGYIARVIELDSLQPNTTNGTVSAELLQRDLEPFTFDSSFVGVKIYVCGSAASFAGDLELEGNIEFKYNNFGDL